MNSVDFVYTMFNNDEPRKKYELQRRISNENYLKIKAFIIEIEFFKSINKICIKLNFNRRTVTKYIQQMRKDGDIIKRNGVYFSKEYLNKIKNFESDYQKQIDEFAENICKNQFNPLLEDLIQEIEKHNSKVNILTNFFGSAISDKLDETMTIKEIGKIQIRTPPHEKSPTEEDMKASLRWLKELEEKIARDTKHEL